MSTPKQGTRQPVDDKAKNTGKEEIKKDGKSVAPQPDVDASPVVNESNVDQTHPPKDTADALDDAAAGETFVDGNGDTQRTPSGPTDVDNQQVNPKDGPVNTASDPSRKVTEVALKDVAARAGADMPATDQAAHGIGQDPADNMATKAEHKEEATKQAERLQSVQDNTDERAERYKHSHAKVKALIDSLPDDTPDDFVIYGYGGAKVTLGDMRVLFEHNVKEG